MYKHLLAQRQKQNITKEMKVMIEDAISTNDEIIARGIQTLLTAQWPDLRVSIPTIKRKRVCKNSLYQTPLLSAPVACKLTF